MTNPYEAPLASAAEANSKESSPGSRSELSKTLTIPLGFALGGITSGIVQVPLMIACFMTPVAHWVCLDGEFDGLLLLALPILSLPAGALAGTFLGVFWGTRYQAAIVLLATIPPAGFLFVMTAFERTASKRQPDQFISSCAIAGFMWLATAAAVLPVALTFRQIERSSRTT